MRGRGHGPAPRGRAVSSVGRAPRLHLGCREFEPLTAHHSLSLRAGGPALQNTAPQNPALQDMALQNKVTPFGDIVAIRARCDLMGNRGILHDADKTLRPARWKHKHWVTCRLSFGGRKREVMALGKYTELFFLDEAVALAAGHRPCGECRHADLKRFLMCWRNAHGGELPRSGDIDRILHKARVHSRSREQIRYMAPIDDLPNGSFVRAYDGDTALLVCSGSLLPYSPGGYGKPRPRPSNIEVEVLTPRPTVETLKAGYVPVLHASAGANNG